MPQYIIYYSLRKHPDPLRYCSAQVLIGDGRVFCQQLVTGGAQLHSPEAQGDTASPAPADRHSPMF